MTGPAWLRLDPRMLLVHPVREVGRFLPALVALLVAGGASGLGPWSLVAVVVPVGLGVVRYLTTSYRITAGRVELRRGLLRRHTLSAPVDRVRTVDLTSSLVHRLLGLTTVVIGTGSVTTDADERLELDALPREQATALRSELLRAGTPVPRPGEQPAAALAEPAVTPVAWFQPRWLWYAPFTSAGVVAAGALLGAVAQAGETLSLRVRLSEDDLAAVTGLVVTGLLLGVVVVAAALAVGGYLVTNWRFTLAREGAAWHVSRGLFTTRETSLDVARVAGVTRGEQAALRLARGSRLSAIVTGLGTGRGSSAVLVPPAPAGVVAHAAGTVLGSDHPMAAPMRSHGPAAVRRRYTRALLGAAPFAAAPVAAVALGAPAWLLVAVAVPVAPALALARDRARGLGHGLVDGFVVVRSGSMLRTRDALAADHVIGWTLRDTWFQRRVGLTTLSATTAGGKGAVHAPDVPAADAVALAAAATPGLLDAFTA